MPADYRWETVVVFFFFLRIRSILAEFSLLSGSYMGNVFWEKSKHCSLKQSSAAVDV
jgi:hypothetical protein